MTFKKGNIEKMIYMNNQIHTDSLFKPHTSINRNTESRITYETCMIKYKERSIVYSSSFRSTLEVAVLGVH